jgi:hypothetical protein
VRSIETLRRIQVAVTDLKRTATSGTRWLFGIAAGLLLLYALNMGLRIAAVKLGVAPWRLGDVGEFLLVLSSMAFFVAGLVADEERHAAPTDEEGDSIPTPGGAL